MYDILKNKVGYVHGKKVNNYVKY